MFSPRCAAENDLSQAIVLAPLIVVLWAFEAFDLQHVKPVPATLSSWSIANKESTIAQEGHQGQQEPSQNTDPEVVRDH